jgi:preprotein translocase subunit SecG
MVATGVYCNTPSPDWKEFRSKYNARFWTEAQAKDSGDTLYIDTRWVVLHSSGEQKIPIERVQNCHKMLNLIFRGENTEELAKVPKTARNPWKPRIGVPNIQFLPLDSSTLNVEYRQTSSNLSGSTPVSDAAGRGDRVNGVLNLYVGSSGHGTILGQAELNSNIVYGLYSAIGGYDVRGTLSGYDMGKTMAHEVGHALGLVHTFSDSKCDGFSPYTDVPESTAPNFTTELFEVSPGVWDQKDDNRYKDRLEGTQISCLHAESDPDSAPNDMGINIMDYGDDEVSIAFTKNQSLMMRTYLQSADNTTLELKSANATSSSSGGSNGGAVSEGDGSAVVAEQSGGSDSGLSTTVIVVISVFSGLALILLLWIAARYYSSGKRVAAHHDKDHTKNAGSYVAYL